MDRPKKEARKGVAIRMTSVERKRLDELCWHYDESASKVIRRLVDERHTRVVK
jgi:hypothetical protein